MSQPAQKTSFDSHHSQGNKIRIGVLMGGRSIEREVSFNSGRTICDHIDVTRYESVPLFQMSDGTLFELPWHFLHRGKIADFEHRIEQEAQKVTWDDLKNYVDFIYIAVHGRYAEDGILQAMLDVLDIPYTGARVFGSALGMNKIVQKQVLRGYEINVPRGVALYPERCARLVQKEYAQQLFDELDERNLSFPFVVKPALEGSSLGMSVAHNEQELLEAIEKARTCYKSAEQPVLIEEKIVGREFTFVGLQQPDRSWRPLPLTEVIIEDGSELYDYEQKYMPGRAQKITPARFGDADVERITSMCCQVARVLQFRTITRIDGFLTKDGTVVIIDPNSLSGMGPSSFIFDQAAAAGMNHTQFINQLIETEFLFMKQEGKVMPASYYVQNTDGRQHEHQKKRVGVLLAGDSNEREISLESGRNVCYKLSPQKYEVTPIFVNDAMELFALPPDLLIKHATYEITPHLTDEIKVPWSQLPEKFDFIFNALHGGRGENGSVQGTLEMLDMPYNGSGVLASAMCMDKYRTNEFLASLGFAVPFGVLVSKTDWDACSTVQEHHALLEKVCDEKKLTFPLIAKPHDDGCSVLVEKCTTIEELKKAVEHVFAKDKTDVLIEECLQGMELTVGVLGNEKTTILPASLALSSDGTILSIEDKFLPGHGENQTPAPLTEYEQALVQHTISEVYKALECKGYARIDCFYQKKESSPTGEDRVVILEINSLPGLTPATCLFHQAAEAGIKPMEFIGRIVELGFELHGERESRSLRNERQTGANELI